MSDLENTIESIARRFARDIVSQLRKTRLNDLVVVTGGKTSSPHAPAQSTQARPEKGPAKTKGKRGTKGGDPVQLALAEVVDERQLTAHEALIVSMAVRGDAREAIPKLLGISPNTFKTQVRVLLRKLGESNLADAANAILRRALR